MNPCDADDADEAVDGQAGDGLEGETGRVEDDPEVHDDPEAVVERAEEPDRPQDDELSELRTRLEAAVRGERYEEAAQLRDELRRAERGEVR